MAYEIIRQAEQFPEQVPDAEPQSQEFWPEDAPQYLKDHIIVDMSGLSHASPEFQDAFRRKMMDTLAGPEPAEPRPPRRRPPPEAAPGGRPSWKTWDDVPRPEDYQDLEPGSPEEWEQLARTWLGPQNAGMWDTPRKLKKRVQETQRTFTPWGKEDYHPYDASPDKWQQYADWKRQRLTGPPTEGGLT